MEGFHVATAYITVVPDTDGFEEELRAKLAGKYTLTVDVLPDTDGFREKLKADLEGMPGVEIDVDPNLAGFFEKIQAAAAAASHGAGVEIPVDAVLSDASLAAAEAQAKAYAAGSGGVTVPLDAQVNTASLLAAEEKARVFVTDSGGVTIPVGADLNVGALLAARDAAQVLADAQPIKIPVDVNTGAAVAGVTALTAATDAMGASAGRAYGVWGALGTQIPLFSGAGVLGIMKTVAAWHLLADVAVEFGAVAIPALIATGAFSVAAAGDVGDMYTHFQNILTISDAMRQNMAPLTGGLTAMQNAVKPEVYQLAGEAINTMTNKMGVFKSLAVGTGTVLDQLGARAEVAISSGGMTTFLRNATVDLQVLGTTAGNVFGIFGNLLKAMPGYAQILSQVVEHATGALEDITDSGVAQGALKIGLAFHGAAIYIGLAATAIGGLVRGGLTIAGNLLEKGATSALAFGEAGEGVSTAMMGMSARAAELAALPWAWIAVAAAGVAFLGYEFVNAGDAADAFNSKINAAVQAAPLGQALSTINDGLSQTQQRLGVASNQMHQFSGATLAVGRAFAPVSGGLQDFFGAIGRADNAADHIINTFIGFHLLSTTTATALTGTAAAAASAVHDYEAYQAEIASLNTQSITFRTHLAGLAVEFGGTAQAMGILTAAGITTKQMLSTNAASWAQVMAQVQATTVAYQDMGQTGGVLGADMNALDIAASEQVTAMSKVNQAWDGTIGIISGGQNAFITFQQDLLAIPKAAKASGASMTGLNAASLTLRAGWQSAYGGAETLIDSLRMMSSVSPGGFPSITKAMKDSIGELMATGKQSGATRDELVSLAQEIDPNITNFAELTKWLGNTKNAGSDLNKILAQGGASLENLAKDAGNLSASMQSDVTAQFSAAKLAANGTDTAIQALAQAMSHAGASAASEHPAMVGLYNDLLKDGFSAQTAQSMIEAMTGAVFKIPTSHTTKITADDSQAIGAIAQTQDYINGLHGKTINIQVAFATSGSVPSSLGLGVRTAGGGVIPGYAPGKDTVLAAVSPGEGILVPEAVKALSPAFVHAMNRKYGGGRKSSGVGYAAGGITEAATFQYPTDIFNISMSVPGGKVEKKTVTPFNYASLAKELLGTGGGYGKFAKQYDAAQKATLEKDMRNAGIKLADAFADGSLKTVTEIKNETVTAIQTLQKYYSGPAATRLEDAIKRQAAAMEKLSAASSKVSTTIANMKSAAAAETTSLQSFSALSAITGTNASGQTVTPGGKGILTGLANDLAQLHRFFAIIGQLQKAKVAKALIQQVIAMGPVQGIQYGEAILTGGAALIKEINSEESQISAAETAIGQRSADIQYGQSISKGFLSGLDAEEAALKKKMDDLGQEIAKELAKALGVPLKDVIGLTHPAAKKPEEKKKPEPKKEPEPVHKAPKPKGPVAEPGSITVVLNGSKGKLTTEEIAGVAHEIGKQLALAT